MFNFMADLRETIYRKLFNVALTNIETVKVEDKSIERVKLSVEAALQFLQQSKNYPYKDKLILQLFDNISVKSSIQQLSKVRTIILIGMIIIKIDLIGKHIENI